MEKEGGCRVTHMRIRPPFVWQALSIGRGGGGALSAERSRKNDGLLNPLHGHRPHLTPLPSAPTRRIWSIVRTVHPCQLTKGCTTVQPWGSTASMSGKCFSTKRRLCSSSITTAGFNPGILGDVVPGGHAGFRSLPPKRRYIPTLTQPRQFDRQMNPRPSPQS